MPEITNGAGLKKLLVSCLLAVGLGFSSSAAAEVILYGTATGFGSGSQGSGGSGGGQGPGTGPGNFSQFYRVDLTTGVATEIASDVGYGGDANGLAIDTGDTIYAGTGGRGPNTLGRGESPTLLFTIDPRSGVGNPSIGRLGIEFGPPDSAGQGPGAGDFEQFGSRRNNIAGWSFEPNSGDLYGMTGRGSQLFVADTGTGLATRIGSACDSAEIGAPGGNCRRGNAIAFDDVGVNDPMGTLFWANDNEVAELDPATGLVVSAVELDFTPFGEPTDPDAPFRVVAMDYHPVTGDLYAAVQQRQAQDSPPPRSTLAILDPRAGSFNLVGAVDGTGVKLDGIAFTSADYEPPPECVIDMSQRQYTDGDTLAVDVFRLANLSSVDVAAEIKVWFSGPGIAVQSLVNQGANGGWVLNANTETDLGPMPISQPINAGVPRGSYELSCRLLDPVTGEMLAEDLNRFEIVDPPGPLTITEQEWTIEFDAFGPGIHTLFMIARFRPLTPAEVEDVAGRLVWDETEVELCTDPTVDGEFITIREVGNNYVDIGDGFESNEQGSGCPINADLENAFDTYGAPNEACVSVTTGGEVFEYCAPLNVIP